MSAQGAGLSNPANEFYQAPTINLPKGGGAIRGMGEKFATNPVTGTGSMSVPIATSLGRSGFGPQLSLAYDSGSGNGPFGFGWSLSIPLITRKTDKGLPRYQDAQESDVFILSGAEDLVPVLKPDGTRDEDDTTVPGYTIHRYRPRIEGLFARIERWTRRSDGDLHWRSISQDNILTVYGKNSNSRIVDPTHPQRIFSWLICETRDDKGNAVLYEYKPEDGAGVELTRPHERNRGDRDDIRRTANRYLKRIRYSNRVPLLDINTGQRPRFLSDTQIQDADWMFEVIFDYGEHDVGMPKPDDGGQWTYRDDPFSTYRTSFEVRTTRLCQRVLMFHHFPDEEGVGNDCLVRSTDFTYSHEQDPTNARNPVYTFLREVTQSGYKRDNGGYLKRSLPPLEFEYTQPVVQDMVEEVDAESLENLPIGLDGADYQWTDLHGEGIPGILTEQAGAWFYKRNLSPINVQLSNGAVHAEAKFAPVELVAVKPNLALAGGAQFMDLAGDGQLDLVVLDGPMPGLYEHDGDEGWQPFRPFTARPNRDMRDPNLKFVDLDGDGHADVLITEDQAFIWHPSLAEEGFGSAQRVHQALNEENGPRLVFAEGAQSIYLADFSGDGLTDLVRIRNGEVCYWPNLGYGRFGAKVTMDHAPHFDNPDQFDHKRMRLADIDGTGTTDIIYLHRDGVHLYFNQSGNSWSLAQVLNVFPRVDNLAAITAVDLLGNGTACLVWSSPLPGDAQRPMRYVNLMGAQKPHLLVKTVNNLGAETRVQYAPSTKFYLQDKHDGKPWITRLPFPVHVVERVETYDHISRNRFVTRYTYHHGYFDGEEREFRGFGHVDQLDTEEFAALSQSAEFPMGENIDLVSHVPPVLTKTWFHTGAYLEGGRISRHFEHEYYREPGLSDDAFSTQLLPDTSLPPGLASEETRDAVRALKGGMLRQEVYALDGSPRSDHPYTVSERSQKLKVIQPRGENRHAVFYVCPCTSLDYHYERNPDDPRISHQISLEIDDFGNVLRAAAIGYGRRQLDPALLPEDQLKQTRLLITCMENRFTNSVDLPDDYRTPLPCESRSFELTGLTLNASTLFDFATIDNAVQTASEIPYESGPDGSLQKRLIEHVRTLYRRNDLAGPLPLAQVESLALPLESYQLAFTPGLITQVFENRVTDAMLVGDGGYAHSDGDSNWWIPSGQVFYSPRSADSAAEELAFARQHFYLPHRFRDPFGATSFVRYDGYDLLMLETEDPLQNKVTVGDRSAQGAVSNRNDYRILQPGLLTDPNRNRTEVTFDVLGMVVGSAVMGKAEQMVGDSLASFEPDLDDTVIQTHIQDPLAAPHAVLRQATTRLVYDLFAYHRTKDQVDPQPAVVYSLARETHTSDLRPGDKSKVQHSFSYSDGFGREIQQKIQAEPGPVPQRDAGGSIIVGADGQPQMTAEDVSPRWVGSGWTVFNNKGKPVRQYEPFFTDTHSFEFDVRIGVSPVLFYDPVERVVATLHPNNTWEKVVFNPWQQETWDVNDTVLVADPKSDPDVGEFFRRLPQTDYLPTWHTLRTDATHLSAFIARYPDPADRIHETRAAEKTAVHAGTHTTAYFDTLGRPFRSDAQNRFERDGLIIDETYPARVELDIEGNQRSVRDAIEQNGDTLGRIVMRYDYDVLGNLIHQASMEAGERWMLNDVTGNPLYAWNSRNHRFRTVYDPLRRPIESYMTEGAGPELLVERTVYGESRPNPAANNLRGQVVQLSDQAGVVTSDEYDFKGNLLSNRRQFAREYKTTLDWSSTVPLEAATYTSRTRYDALNRPVEVQSPDNSVIRPGYNEANLLERIEANLRGAAVATPFVVDIDYDAKGQRTAIEYGNGVTTTYAYDPLTFRLTHLLTWRNASSFPGDCPQPPAPGWPGCQVQNLHYTYDPAGNITHIRDNAQQTIFFRNRRVEPSNDYTYDAVYRLIEATGREHLGQMGGAQVPHSHDDAPRVGLLHPSDDNAMGTYVERYIYDAMGNFLEMQHRGSDPTHPGWTRTYAYEETSQVEPTKQSNRLTSTTIGATTEIYSANQDGYDEHGSMLRMPHLTLMQWDYRDQLQTTSKQAATASGAPETTWYVYDAAGQRVRKVTERQNGTRRKERTYLGAFEVYKEFNGSGSTVTLARETLHIMDDRQRIALVETRTQGNDGSPGQLIRYQVSNHLGTASVELDAQAQIISYEEYFPYGSTSYQASRSQAEVQRKRYRYTGKERDEETGLSYHRARYYVLWLGRWLSTDPAGLVDGVNLYRFSRGHPINLTDPYGTDSSSSSVITGLNDLRRTDERAFSILLVNNPQFVESALAQYGYRSSALPKVALERFDRAVARSLLDRSTQVTGLREIDLPDFHPDDQLQLIRGPRGGQNVTRRSVREANKKHRPGNPENLALTAYVAAAILAPEALLVAETAGNTGQAVTGVKLPLPIDVATSNLDDVWEPLSTEERVSSGILAVVGVVLHRLGRQPPESDFAKKWPHTAAFDAQQEVLDAIEGYSKTQKGKIVTITGGTNRATGEVQVGVKIRGEHPNLCSEDLCAQALGGNSDDIVLSETWRPRTEEIIGVCPRCQSTFDSSQFPIGTKFDIKGSNQ